MIPIQVKEGEDQVRRVPCQTGLSERSHETSKLGEGKLRILGFGMLKESLWNAEILPRVHFVLARQQLKNMRPVQNFFWRKASLFVSAFRKHISMAPSTLTCVLQVLRQRKKTLLQSYSWPVLMKTQWPSCKVLMQTLKTLVKAS